MGSWCWHNRGKIYELYDVIEFTDDSKAEWEVEYRWDHQRFLDPYSLSLIVRHNLWLRSKGRGNCEKLIVYRLIFLWTLIFIVAGKVLVQGKSMKRNLFVIVKTCLIKIINRYHRQRKWRSTWWMMWKTFTRVWYSSQQARTTQLIPTSWKIVLRKHNKFNC
jgi:hypothetical protein